MQTNLQMMKPDADGPDSDRDLIGRIAEGDRRAIEVLFARHRVKVYRFLLRLVDNSATADDLTSDVFLEVWKQAHRFGGRSQVTTWMLAIARNKALSARRRRVDVPLDDAMADTIPSDTADAQSLLESEARTELLRQSLTQLSPAHREIVDLVYYHGKSIAEVAEITAVPHATVKTRMFYARKRLADLLGGQGFAAAA